MNFTHNFLVERIDRTPADVNRAPYDPFETEIRMLREALGPALPVVTEYFGFKMPENREELDETIGALINGKLTKRC